ncbi:MAG: DNA replication and repair protein RecF [Candidatus Babeliales bacterium]
MQICNLELKHFRCFPQIKLAIEGPLSLIVGPNGSGKTSILEALHYACYLRSFRSSSPKELIHFEEDNFFIKINLQDYEIQFNHDIQIGFTGKKRLVKVDQHAISSYKELIKYYRIITITEDDIGLIKEGPDIRRTFIDQACALINPDFIQQLRTYKQILQNRNALLQGNNVDNASYEIWTAQLFENAQIIQKHRQAFLKNLEQQANKLIGEYFDSVKIAFSYQAKKKTLDATCLEDFLSRHESLKQQEYLFKRSLFGPHLDDISIQFKGKASKSFASRGQQKLLILLIKIAQLQELTKAQGPVILLLDDFMTDFDAEVAQKLLKILMNLSTQLIFTSPVEAGTFEQQLLKYGAQRLLLTY